MTMDVDMSEAQQVVNELAQPGLKISYNDLLVKVVATALKENPPFNAVFTTDGMLVSDSVNVGVAVSIKNGLVVPVVRGADKLGVKEIARTIDDLVEKARNGSLSTRETSGGTFTVSNLGMYDIQMFAPVINPHESAILGVGRVMDKPVVLNGMIVSRPILTLTLVFDHRITDGSEAAQFLQRIKNILENPRNVQEVLE
jgi:pyruvate dehydrogenase E2 component (dihydrolipoamide acetyltransferase)